MKTKSLYAIIIFLVVFTQSSFASNLEIYSRYVNQGEIKKCLSGKDGCFSVLAPKNTRGINPLLGYLQIDHNNGIVYAQDIKTKKIKGFRYAVQDNNSLNCAVKYAQRYIVEQYLGMDIQTNVRPDCF